MEVGKASPGVVTNVEEYNGSSWTSGGDLKLPDKILGWSGTQTAAFVDGGVTPLESNATEEYNGSSWTSANSPPR